MKLFYLEWPGYPARELDPESGLIDNLHLGQSAQGPGKVLVPLLGEGPFFGLKEAVGEPLALLRSEAANDDETGQCLCIIDAVDVSALGCVSGFHDATGVTELAHGICSYSLKGKRYRGRRILALIDAEGSFRCNDEHICHWYQWTGVSWISSLLVEAPEEHERRLALIKPDDGGMYLMC